MFFQLLFSFVSLQKLLVEGDSLLVVRQLQEKYSVKAPSLVPLHQEAMDLAKRFRVVEFVHIVRSLNSRADELANLAIDRRVTAEKSSLIG